MNAVLQVAQTTSIRWVSGCWVKEYLPLRGARGRSGGAGEPGFEGDNGAEGRVISIAEYARAVEYSGQGRYETAPRGAVTCPH